MNKRERTALTLERKILRAIERGEFTPDYGYLSQSAFITKNFRSVEVQIGPCGCALAAAASVNGKKVAEDAYVIDSDVLRAFLRRTAGVAKEDAFALENGYEGRAPYYTYDPRVEIDDDIGNEANPYFPRTR